MDAKYLALAIRQTADKWQEARNLCQRNCAHSDQFQDAIRKQGDPDGYLRERATESARLTVFFGNAAADLRNKLRDRVEELAKGLGQSAPRPLVEFGVHLRPHGSERMALELWPAVQVELEFLNAATPSPVAPKPPASGESPRGKNPRALLSLLLDHHNYCGDDAMLDDDVEPITVDDATTTLKLNKGSVSRAFDQLFPMADGLKGQKRYAALCRIKGALLTHLLTMVEDRPECVSLPDAPEFR